MSPNESQLRAALRDGEGDGIDAGLLIANGNRIRRERRRRINTGIGVAAVVGVLGSFALLIGTRVVTDESGGGGNAADRRDVTAGGFAPGAAPGAAGGNAGRSAARSAAASATATAQPSAPADHGRAVLSCPPNPVHLQSGGGSSGSLVPAAVSSISACAYPATGTRVLGAKLVGVHAQAFVRNLNDAPKRPHKATGPCVSPFDGQGSVQLRVYDSNGSTLVGPLTVTPDCHQAKVTDGAVTRYPRHLPAPLPRLLRTVR